MNKKLDMQNTEYSYEIYEKELSNIIAELENNKIETLDKLVENYEYGMNIIQKCEDILKNAEMKIQKINEKISNEVKNETK